jgi:hypothetical protein
MDAAPSELVTWKRGVPFWPGVGELAVPLTLGSGAHWRRKFIYLWVMVKTPSQPEGGSSNKYSWQRFQYARAGPSSGH